MPMLIFGGAVSKTAVTSLHSKKACSKIVSGYSAWIASTPDQISSRSVEKCVRKWSREVSLCSNLVTSRQDPGQWKWYRMAKMVSHMSSWTASQTNMTHYIDPYDTHMDKKKAFKQFYLSMMNTNPLYWRLPHEPFLKNLSQLNKTWQLFLQCWHVNIVIN